MLLVFIDERNQSNEIIVTSNKICKGFSGPRDFAGLLLSFAIAAVSRLLAIYLPQLGGATIAILLGILLGNTFFKQPVLAIGTKFAESKLLEFLCFFTRCNCHRSNDCSNWCKRNCFCVTTDVNHYHRCLLDW